MARSTAKEGDLAAAERGEMARGLVPATTVVRADRDPGLSRLDRPPADEMGSVFDQIIETQAMLQIIAIAQQNEPVGLVVVLVIFVPIRGLLLEGDQQIVSAARAGAGDRAQHRDEERVDCRV